MTNPSGEAGSGRPAPPRVAPVARSGPVIVLAADHRARGLMTIERYADLLAAVRAALPHCDGLLASTRPLTDLVAGMRDDQATYLSLNRTGLAGSAFELDDRLVVSVGRAAAEGWTGGKLITRIAPDDTRGAAALELLARVLEEAAAVGLDVMVEPWFWRDGKVSRATDDVVFAAVVAHDLGSPLLKVPVPDAPAGAARQEAVARVVASVGVPVLFLGGPRTGGDREAVLAETADVMAGGGGGLAIGRAVLRDADPGAMAAQLAAVVHATG